MSEHEDMLVFNGINGAAGTYDIPPMRSEELVDFVTGEAEPENLDELRARAAEKNTSHYGVKEGVDPTDLSDAGWGIIFTHDADEAIIEALEPLIALRREQAGDKFRMFTGRDGIRPKENKSRFLARHQVAPGPADPDKMPYYLLIVGDPQKIPINFQFQLDVQYAVGRIFFDKVEDYHNYARSVVAAEQGAVRSPKELAFFGVANPDDAATNLSLEHLVLPLAEVLGEKEPDWKINSYTGDEATKSRLTSLISGQERPAMLFSASHGMSFPLEDDRQLPHQGALLCGEWPGPKQWGKQGAIPQDYYFAGDDLTSDSAPAGLLTFHFACYGAGVPMYDDFSRQAFKKREQIAPAPFIASLPQRMLAHPKGGALAIIGHVDRTWGYSFNWPRAGRQTTVFESTMQRLLQGGPVGYAMDYFNERYAELAADLTTELEEIEFGKKPNAFELSGLWTAHNDARDYVVIGDPAVRLPLVADNEETLLPERIDLDVSVASAKAKKAEAPKKAEKAAKPVAKTGAPAKKEPAGSAKAEAPRNAKPTLSEDPDPVEDPIEDAVEALAPKPEPVAGNAEEPISEVAAASVAEPEPEPEAEPPVEPTESGSAEETHDDTSDDHESHIPPEQLDFGIREKSDNLMRALRKMPGRLTDLLADTMDNLGALEICTYTSDDIQNVRERLKDEDADDVATLWAITKIDIAGNVTNVVPQKMDREKGTAPDIDNDLWELHLDSVRAVQERRIALIRALIEMLITLRIY